LSIFSAKQFFITFGNGRITVFLYRGKKLLSKTSFAQLNEDNKKQIEKLCLKNRSADISILVDDGESTFQRKNYSAGNKQDIKNLAEKEINSNPSKLTLRKYEIFKVPNSDHSNQKSTKLATKKQSFDIIFASLIVSGGLEDLLNTILEMPNYLAGLYLIPVEVEKVYSSNYSKFFKAKLAKEVQDNKKLLKDKNDQGLLAGKQNLGRSLTKRGFQCLVFATHAGGLRYLISSEFGLIFTRIVEYQAEDKDFAYKFNKDIYRSFEYLKRIYPDIVYEDFMIEAIFPSEILEKIKQKQDFDFKIRYLSLSEFATELNFRQYQDSGEGKCDSLFTALFAGRKLSIRFSNAKMKIVDRLVMILKASRIFNLAILFGLLCFVAYAVIKDSELLDSLDRVSEEKLLLTKKLVNINKNSLKEKLEDADNQQLATEEEDQDKIAESKITVEKVIDIGRLYEALGVEPYHHIEAYKKLEILNKFDVNITGFLYEKPMLERKNPKKVDSYNLAFYGILFNKTGDVEELFKNFDGFTQNVKKEFADFEITNRELPRDIDFSRKYYEAQIQFKVTKK
jgi:hypothetical protein